MKPDSYFYHYLFIGLFTLFAIVFPIAILLVAGWIAPKKPSPTKSATYECGMVSKGDSWIQFRVQFYIFALIFVVFDIETVFIYPWAVAYKQLGFFAFAEMFIFIAILAVGLIYAWNKKALEWE
ncbi:MAG: NADH-quinone oxidoreductase subunit A [Candidatus Omnitrophica bacterium]|nr:NADH-quinone oxidoreductase subunit A [Candidatus Omnitrophota bacterium]MDD5671424.1 NADH-quinone oxidoreductase subunit A [Candidatus Omnitrophota bacterium]